jgi:hypothetical protein
MRYRTWFLFTAVASHTCALNHKDQHNYIRKMKDTVVCEYKPVADRLFATDVIVDEK